MRRDRSILRKVIGQPCNWFRNDSTSEKPIPTTNRSEALSQTAIIPSYIDYTPWRETGVPSADIWLYKIPQDLASESTRKVILTEGFIHEIGHSIVQPALYIKNYYLEFPKDRLFKGLDAMLKFAESAEKHPPISHYSAIYRSKNNRFESGNDAAYELKRAISEEMCESIAAYLLGFVYSGDEARNKAPFADRLEIFNFVEGFLNAKKVVD